MTTEQLWKVGLINGGVFVDRLRLEAAKRSRYANYVDAVIVPTNAEYDNAWGGLGWHIDGEALTRIEQYDHRVLGL